MDEKVKILRDGQNKNIVSCLRDGEMASERYKERKTDR